MSDLSLGLDPNELQPIVPPGDVGTGMSSLGMPDTQTQPFEGLSAESANQNAALALSPRSLNLTPPSGTAVADRTQADRDYLQSLPTMEKIGLAMQSFKAGFDGTASPIDTLLTQRRLKEKTDRENLVSTINVLQKGTEILRKLPQGSLQRQAVAEELGKVVGPKFAPLFAAAGSEHDDAIKNYLDIMGDKEVQQMAVKQCSGASDFSACILKLSVDDSWGKRAEKVVDSKRLGAITTKMRSLSDSMKTQGKDSFTLADITTLNKDNSLFTPEEMNTIGRNEAFWGDIGLKSEKTIQAAAETAAKAAERPASEKIVTRNIGGTEYLYDPGKAKPGKRLTANEDWVALGPAGNPKTNDLSEAQMLKLRREKTGYDNAQRQLEAFGIDITGRSSKPSIQDRLTPNKPMTPTSNIPMPNPKYDRVFEGRVKAWLKSTEAGDPFEREGLVQPEAPAAPAATPKAEAPARAAAPQAKAAPTVTTKAQFDALPAGAEFIDARDGKRKRKAGA